MGCLEGKQFAQFTATLVPSLKVPTRRVDDIGRLVGWVMREVAEMTIVPGEGTMLLGEVTMVLGKVTMALGEVTIVPGEGTMLLAEVMMVLGKVAMDLGEVMMVLGKVTLVLHEETRMLVAGFSEIIGLVIDEDEVTGCGWG